MQDVYSTPTLDQLRQQGIGTPKAQPPGPGFVDSIRLGFNQAGAAPDWGLNQYKYEGSIIGDVQRELIKRGHLSDIANADSVPGSSMYAAPLPWRTRIDRLLALASAERARDPKFLPDYAGIGDYAGVQALARSRRQADMQATTAALQGGSSAGQLVGELGHGFTDPLSYIPVGGGPARGAAMSIGGYLLRRAAFGAAVNAGVATIEQPATIADAKSLGIDMGAGDVARNIGFAAALGGVLDPAVSGAGHGVGALVDHFRATVPAELRTGDESAALNVLGRDAEVRAGSPFVSSPAGDDAHLSRLDAAIGRYAPSPIDGDAPAPARPVPRVTVREAQVAAGEPLPANLRFAARDQVKARMRTGGESRSDTDVNPLSSASGRYQFTYNTWLGYYRRRYGGGEGAAAIWAKRFDPNLQEVLENDLLADAGHALQAHGHPETPGSLYLLHFAGEEGGLKILDADPATPIERIMSADAVARNRFLKGKTAGDVVAWADRKMGGPATPHTGGGEALSPRWGEAEAAATGDPSLWAGDRAVVDDAPAGAAAAPERVQFADYEPHPGGIEAQERPNLRPGLFARPEDHAAHQLEVWREEDAARGFAVMEPDRASAAPAASTGPAGETKAPAISVEGRAPMRRSGPLDAMQAIADAGGLRDDEGHALVEGRNIPKFVPGAGEIVRKGGRTLDAMGEHLWEQGFFGPPATTDRPRADAVLELLDRAAREKVYKPEDAAAMAARQAQREAMPEHEAAFEMQSHAAEHGVALDPATLEAAMVHRANGETVEGALAAAVHEAAFRDAAPAAGLERFADPHGEGAVAQIASIEHDMRMHLDAGRDFAVTLDGESAPVPLSRLLAELDEEEKVPGILRACLAAPAAAAAE